MNPGGAHSHLFFLRGVSKKPGSQSGAQEVKILLDLNQPLPSYMAMANDLISLFNLAPPVKCRLTTTGFHQAQRWTFKWDECRGLRENEEFKMFFALLLKKSSQYVYKRSS